MSGFTYERAAAHNEIGLREVEEHLRQWGATVTRVPLNGYSPDLHVIAPAGNWFYAEVKMPTSMNLAIAADEFDYHEKLGNVYWYWRPAWGRHWFCETAKTLRAHQDGGRRERSGSGSNTDWYLFRWGR